MLFLAHCPNSDLSQQRFDWLGETCCGSVIAPDAADGALELNGAFTLITFAACRRRGFFDFVAQVGRYVSLGRRLLRTGPDYDFVLAVGLFKTAIAGWILAALHRKKLIIELPILPRQIVLHRKPRPSRLTSARARLVEFGATIVLRRADHVKAIFPGQLEAISPTLRQVAWSAFPDFVAVNEIARGAAEEHLLVLGTPLHLKGADLAIRAFSSIVRDFPGERLLIVGSALGFPALAPAIRPGDPIELVDFVEHDVAIKYLQRAKVVLIPSRTDAMPRVAIEAMAAGKAIVAARVNGMSHYLRSGRNCLLCEPNDVGSLAEAIRALLAGQDLRRALGARARTDALEHFDERRYAMRFGQMLEDAAVGAAGRAFDYD